MTIKIYKQEIVDGIGDLVKSTASIAYCSEATAHEGKVSIAKSIVPQDIMDKILAENKDQVDLHYIEAVLVSTGMNKNDDVFTSQAAWDARHTPEDKQFNFMHNENDIIGHITGSYVLTKDGKTVGDDDIQRPEEFDIITQSVLYNSWNSPENRERMDKIISEIKENKWYVSMECLFSGFDYAVIDDKGNAQILPRNEESAFLTKHLRAYGGTGEYEGRKIGRALSKISFSGKGLVEKPANPRSVILSAANDLNFSEYPESQISIGEFNMADQSLEKEVMALRAECEAAKAENQKIKTEIAEAKDKEFAARIESFEAAANTASATIEELNELIKSTQARVAELEDALATSTTALSTAKEEVAEMHKKEKYQKREAALVDAGLEGEEIIDSLASLSALEDEAFDSVVALMKKKAKFVPFGKKDKEDDKDKDKKKDKKSDAQDTTDAEPEPAPELFEGVESSEATMVVSEPENATELARANISDWFANNVLNK